MSYGHTTLKAPELICLCMCASFCVNIGICSTSKQSHAHFDMCPELEGGWEEDSNLSFHSVTSNGSCG